MSFQYKTHCKIEDISTEENKNFNLIKLNEEEYGAFIDWLVQIIPLNYYDPNKYEESLRRLGTSLGKEKAREIANQQLLAHFPTQNKIQSGDFGEILAQNYINQEMEFTVPIFKLRFKDHNNMAMRGDDVLGIKLDSDFRNIRFLKGESKSHQVLSTDKINEARSGLDTYDGKPPTHSVQFVIDRLSESGKTDIADTIAMKFYLGIQESDVEHLMFVFTTSPPDSLQKTNLDNYSGKIPQHYIGFRESKHQEIIRTVFDKMVENYNGTP